MPTGPTGPRIQNLDLTTEKSGFISKEGCTIRTSLPAYRESLSILMTFSSMPATDRNTTSAWLPYSVV